MKILVFDKPTLENMGFYTDGGTWSGIFHSKLDRACGFGDSIHMGKIYDNVQIKHCNGAPDGYDMLRGNAYYVGSTWSNIWKNVCTVLEE